MNRTSFFFPTHQSGTPSQKEKRREEPHKKKERGESNMEHLKATELHNNLNRIAQGNENNIKQ
jgi:hypothetical protein